MFRPGKNKLQKRKLRGNLVTVFDYMTGGYKGGGDRLYSLVRRDRTRRRVLNCRREM